MGGRSGGMFDILGGSIRPNRKFGCGTGADEDAGSSGAAARLLELLCFFANDNLLTRAMRLLPSSSGRFAAPEFDADPNIEPLPASESWLGLMIPLILDLDLDVEIFRGVGSFEFNPEPEGRGTGGSWLTERLDLDCAPELPP
jgi:hypothetical protein